jgi:hypothetical protein
MVVTQNKYKKYLVKNHAQQIIDSSEDAITVVFVGNSGSDSKVMMALSDHGT